jgi:U3 small nucleolar RNA-associated protein 18
VSAGALTKKSTQRLPQSLLEVTRVKDANQHEYAEAAIQCTRFHPNAAVMLTAGLDKALRLFQIDGKENAKIQSVFIKELPIHSADFSADGTQIYMSGRRPFFYVYDMQSGAIDKVHRLQGVRIELLYGVCLSSWGVAFGDAVDCCGLMWPAVFAS